MSLASEIKDAEYEEVTFLGQSITNPDGTVTVPPFTRPLDTATPSTEGFTTSETALIAAGALAVGVLVGMNVKKFF
jgi:hypothetical protein